MGIKPGWMVGGLLALLLGVWLALPATSEPKGYQRRAELTERALSGRPETFADLVRLLVPDLAPVAGAGFQGSWPPGLRHLFSEESDEESPGRFSLLGVNYFWLQDQGQKLLVLSFEPSEGRPAILAAYRMEPRAALVDAVEIRQAGHCSLSGESLLDLGSGHWGFLLDCWHDNSSESFSQSTVVGLVEHRFKALLELPVAYGHVEFYNPELCKTAAKFQVRVAGPDSGRGCRDLQITFDRRTVCHPDEGVWDWDTGVLDRQSVTRSATWDAAGKVYRDPFAGQKPRQATGVVYSLLREGASPWSELRLYSQGKLLRALGDDGQVPEPGDLCTIRYRPGWDRNQLLQARSLKKSDPAVRAALAVLTRHYGELGRGDYRAAYAELSSAWRRSQSYQDFAQGGRPRRGANWLFGLKVIGHNRRQVLVLCVASDVIENTSGCLRFTLMREGQAWVIDRVDRRPLVEWVRG